MTRLSDSVCGGSTRRGSDGHFTCRAALCALAWLYVVLIHPGAGEAAPPMGPFEIESYEAYKADVSAVQALRPHVTLRATGLSGSASSSGGTSFGVAFDPVIFDGAGCGVGTGARVPYLIPMPDTHSGGGSSGEAASGGGVYVPSGIPKIGGTLLSFPQAGELKWQVGLDYNNRQYDGSHYISNGPAGNNFANTSQLAIALYDDIDNEKDMVVLIIGATRFAEFKRFDDNSSQFVPLNGATGAFVFAAGATDEPDTYTYHDMHGHMWVFFGFDADAEPATGQLWKMIEYIDGVPAEHIAAYVGHPSTGSTAISSGFNGAGQIRFAYDITDRQYEYEYADGLLTEVTVRTKTSGTWASPSGVAVVGHAAFTHYDDADGNADDNDDGDTGDLKFITVTVPLNDGDFVDRTYIRYYTGTFNSESNPGQPGDIKLVIRGEGLRRLAMTDEQIDDAADLTIKPSSSGYYTYDNSHRVIESTVNGKCGCSGGNNGTYTYRYEDNGSFDTDPGDIFVTGNWFNRVVIKTPGTYNGDVLNTWVTQYFTPGGEVTAIVLTDDDPEEDTPVPQFWATVYVRDANGRVIEASTPANITAYDHDTGACTRSASVGLVHKYTRFSSGDIEGLVEHVKFSQGSSGTAYLSRSTFYDTASLDLGDAVIHRPVLVAQTLYTQQTSTEDEGPGNSPPSGAYRTEMAYTFYDDNDPAEYQPLMIKEVITTAPVVSTGKNGPNSATETRQHFRQDGSPDFSISADGLVGYQEFTNGQLTKSIQDADITKDDVDQDFDGITIPSGYATTGTPLHKKNLKAYDAQGRSTGHIDYRVLEEFEDIEHVAQSYHTHLDDGRLMTLVYPQVDDSGSPTKYYGPVQFTVTNLAGQVEAQGLIALDDNSGLFTEKLRADHIDESVSDPLLAINHDAEDRIGLVVRLNTNIYDEVGSRVQESRQYFAIPASGAGSSGTHYDATKFAYDDAGHRWRVEDPTGTVHRTKFDALGRTVEQWIGTNDYHADFPGGDVAGTLDMVRTQAMEYDSGADQGNSHLTSRSAFVEDDDTDERVSTMIYDFRGRAIVQISPEAAGPHTVNKYDNLGRVIATAQYSDDAGLDETTDPTTEDTNRLSLSQTFYDELGRVWKTQRHKIDQSDGSDLDNLQQLTWYDAAGRVIKVKGSQLTKTQYDRLGRTINSFILATTDDDAYDDADDVAGDLVLQQSNTAYNQNNGLVLMTATIERFHDDGSDGTTGPLDTNADDDPLMYTAADLEGRIQISANWYDVMDRLVDTVNFGTFDDVDFEYGDFSGSAPARDDDALRTTYVYNPDGTMLSVTDPRGKVTQYVYDALGRQTAIINNYVNGTPSGSTGDDDVYTRFTYSAGLKTQMWVDINGDNDPDDDDQVTQYIYGVAPNDSPGASMIASNNLLRQVIYPPQYIDPSEQPTADRQVLYAYNAQGQQIWMQDQEEVITQFNYDDSGRQIHKRFTLPYGTAIDGAVLRISTTYDSLGRRSLVTQWNNASPGSGTALNEVMFVYDDWGNLARYRQDNNSQVDAYSSVDDYEVNHTYEEPDSVTSGGRNTLRRTQTQYLYPSTDATTIGYLYLNNQARMDDTTSRVTRITIGTGSPTVVASYRYSGVGSVIVTEYSEPSLISTRYGGSPGVYPGLDFFNRVVSDTWTRNSSSITFFDTAIAYDRNSNIISTIDNIFTPSISSGFDAIYTMDGLNRLTKDEQGDYTPGSPATISSRSRQQIWSLTQTGNWALNRLDRNGDNDFIDSGAGEVDDQRTHNNVNELVARDLDTDNDTAYDDTHYDLSYNLRGDMVDDGQNYTYIYDAPGRLRKILTRGGSPALVKEFTYNGLGHRVSVKYDTDADTDVDGSDKTYHLAYDERWRIVAVYREDDDDPKEVFVYHAPGSDGHGGSAYIDTVILRDKDANTNWVTAASDGVLERRDYYCHNWRGDVVALITDAGKTNEWVKYSAYGIPYGIPKCDTNGDGTVDSTDGTNLSSWFATPANKPTGDHDLDGDIDIDDTVARITNSGLTLGWGVLSKTGGTGFSANRKGYAGYEFDAVASVTLWHVRHRVLNSDLGRWTRRDPLEYIDGANAIRYAKGNPIANFDPSGLTCNDCESAKITILSDPRYQNLIDNIAWRCPQCGYPDITCSSSDSGPCGISNNGYTNPGDVGDCPTIVLCCNASPQPTDGYIETMIHELVHYYDSCAFLTSPLSWNACTFCVFTEVRANRASGPCAGMQPGSAAQCSCANQRACQSCRNNGHCLGAQCQAALNKLKGMPCNCGPTPWSTPPDWTTPIGPIPFPF